MARRWYIVSLLGCCLLFFQSSLNLVESKLSNAEIRKGIESKESGDLLFADGDYESAAGEYWKAVLFHGQTPEEFTYNVQEVFERFLKCYVLLGKAGDGLAFVSLESFRRGQLDMGRDFLNRALEIDPHNEAALAVQKQFADKGSKKTSQKLNPTTDNAKLSDQSKTTTTTSTQDPTPEDLYAVASNHFSNKQYEQCADVFEISCLKSGLSLGPSCVNAVYCRTMICDWGFNGTQFQHDMQRVQNVTLHEAHEFRKKAHTADYNNALPHFDTLDNNFAWRRATSVHPHMMLGFPLDNNLILKRYAAESIAYMDEMMARFGQAPPGTQHVPPLPDDLPFPVDPEPWKEERQLAGPSYKIRVGFVGSGFNSKAVLYLSQDMFRFFDRNVLEIHIFSFNAPDSPLFLQHGMRGVDWRKRVQSNVDYFHDLQHMVNHHIDAARYVHSQKIHILIEWDGYARQGERAQGLFGLRPAPVQMLHQEYLGTSGALYVDYLFTDQITSPLEQTQHFYTEKLIFMPNHFFSKGHAMQAEVHRPSFEYTPRPHGIPYRLGTGTPQQNRCLAKPNDGPHNVSFVFCNWNKFLKNNPETVRSWIRILREVPNSILCLLENPAEGKEYLRKFVHEAAGISKGEGNPWESFQPGDGDALNKRIHFLAWEKNPFDHQRRNIDFCNAMLDSFPYNGHTVAQDALYAGVPIVTRSDGLDMSSRVTTSANVVLGLPHLNAVQGPIQYEDIAIQLATNSTLFQETRSRLIDTCLKRNPMHPYWDVPRYVKNFEQGLLTAWNRFLDDLPPEHIFIQETEQAQAGTFDEEILAHPQDGPI